MPEAGPTLVGSGPRWAQFAITGFFAVSAVAVAKNGLSGWHHLVGLLICLVVVLYGVATIIVRPRWEVRDDKLVEIGLFTRETFDLRRCGRFSVQRKVAHGWYWIIVFDYDGAPGSSLQTYGRDAEKLAARLNEARERVRHA